MDIMCNIYGHISYAPFKLYTVRLNLYIEWYPRKYVPRKFDVYHLNISILPKIINLAIDTNQVFQKIYFYTIHLYFQTYILVKLLTSFLGFSLSVELPVDTSVGIPSKTDFLSGRWNVLLFFNWILFELLGHSS
jgi:hypothetical protein